MSETRTHVDFLLALAEHLAQIAVEHGVIAYGDLTSRFRSLGFNAPSPRAWGELLGDLSRICIHNQLPAISAVVVNKDTHLPGSGFFDLVGHHRNGVPVPMNQWQAYWDSEIDAVYKCTNWARLTALLKAESHPTGRQS